MSKLFRIIVHPSQGRGSAKLTLRARDGFTACQRVRPCRCSIFRIGYLAIAHDKLDAGIGISGGDPWPGLDIAHGKGDGDILIDMLPDGLRLIEF